MRMYAHVKYICMPKQKARTNTTQGKSWSSNTEQAVWFLNKLVLYTNSPAGPRWRAGSSWPRLCIQRRKKALSSVAPDESLGARAPDSVRRVGCACAGGTLGRLLGLLLAVAGAKSGNSRRFEKAGKEKGEACHGIKVTENVLKQN